jgi:hypothetical protein
MLSWSAAVQIFAAFLVEILIFISRSRLAFFVALFARDLQMEKFIWR